MWRSVRLDSATGQWVIIAEQSSLEELRAHTALPAGDDSPVYYFSTEKPHSAADADRIVHEVMAANNGRIVRATIGLELSVPRKKRTSCPGNCFCVVQGGSRRCETYYCNEWMCWWVPCGVGC